MNLTAAGEETPESLRKALEECPVKEIARAISEGIHRWHTYCKEKE